MSIEIVHAENTFEERDPPYLVLHVETKLPQKPDTPGFNAEARYEMMKVIGLRVPTRAR
jgi:hypothetical protein